MAIRQGAAQQTWKTAAISFREKRVGQERHPGGGGRVRVTPVTGDLFDLLGGLDDPL
jgi:hypothetical protein